VRRREHWVSVLALNTYATERPGIAAGCAIPATKAKKIFRSVMHHTLSAPSMMNSIHDPRVTGEDGRISKGGKRGRRDLAPQPWEATTRVGGSRQRAMVLPDRRRSERPPSEPSRALAQAARGFHGAARRYWPSTCPRSRAPVSAMEPTSSQKITGAAGDLSCRRGE
jgi:hypothetical protein